MQQGYGFDMGGRQFDDMFLDTKPFDYWSHSEGPVLLQMCVIMELFSCLL